MSGLLLLVFLAQTELPVLLPPQPTARPVETPVLAQATAPLSEWAGAPVAVDDAAGPADLPAGEALFQSGAILIPRARLAAFQSSQELAGFLSHAVAHQRLGHPARVQEKLEKIRQLRVATTHAEHIAQAMLAELQTEQAAMEREAEALAPEILATSGCAPGRCELFERLLAAVRR
jgi:hypothetical protein